MKGKLWYIFGLLVIFLAVIVVLFFKKGNGDIISGNATLMGEATLPVVYPCYDDIRINRLYGYVGEVDIMSTRDTLTPLNDDRLFSMQIDTYGAKVTGISYEIRSIDMSRILEKTEIKDWKEEEGVIYASFQADNLMTAGMDYHFILKLSLKDGREVGYYTRFVYGLDNIKEKLEYVLDFHERTFDKEEALEIVRYLESGAKGDNTNFGAVNIYSSFQQITWGELKVERVGESNISLKDVNGNISYFVVDYLARIENMYGTDELYRVKEYYRTRHTSTRTYLLEFERTMEQYFTPVSENIYSNNINVGITEDIDNTISDKKEDSQGKRVCFGRNGELWEYYSAENRLTRIFSFRGEDETDVRTSRVEHDIRIARIDNEGNVTFMVYGYMSKGEHEGEVGISVCRYNEADNKVSELLYIPYNKSYDRLSESYGGICYLNPSNWLYFVLEGKLYSIDLGSKEYTVLLGNLEEGSYITNKAGNTLVMQQKYGDFVQGIKILNLETNKEVSVSCAEDEVIKLLGYMEEDIVYGVAKKSDVFTELSGDLVYYFYKLCIMEEDTTEVGLYKKDNIYIKEAEILDGMITLERYSKNEEGDFEAILTDYLTRNTSESRKALTLRYVTTDLKKKEAVLTITATKKEGKPEVNDEVDIYVEEGNHFELSTSEVADNKYYVYAKGEYGGSFTNLADAIRLADSKMGLVVNDKGQYIWKRGNVYSSISLSDISVQPDEDNTLAACMDAMLKKAGVTAVSCRELLVTGKGIADIINSEMTTYLSFEGLSLDKILYSVNDGRPVVGKLADEEYVLITGYDTNNVIMYSAITGSRSKMNMTEATKQFEAQGNIFFSYIK